MLSCSIDSPPMMKMSTTVMRLLGSIPKGLFLSIAILVIHIYVATAKQPLILDSDHGYFIDDIFAMACFPMMST